MAKLCSSRGAGPPLCGEHPFGLHASALKTTPTSPWRGRLQKKPNSGHFPVLKELCCETWACGQERKWVSSVSSGHVLRQCSVASCLGNAGQSFQNLNPNLPPPIASNPILSAQKTKCVPICKTSLDFRVSYRFLSTLITVCLVLVR